MRVSLRLLLASLVATLVAATLSALPPASAAAAGTLPPLPLRTQGNRIVDATGQEVVLQGVNWFGMETSTHAPHGLWSRDYRDMLRQMASLGFNTVRLPFSLQSVRAATTNGIDYGAGRNAALAGRTPLQVMDEIIAEAGRNGLMVILDNHSQADDGFMYDLWYGQSGFTEDDWVATWRQLAARYRDTPNVIGFDLKNEPHGAATWGTGGATDWRRAAERAGNAVLADAPDKLILVEGIEGQVAGGQQLDRHWWGGNLEGVRANPVRLSVPNRLVYSPHEYGPGVFAQPWFSDPNVATILADRWDKGFGYIHDQGIAPVLIGEFGAKNVGLDTTEGRWIRQFADYLGRKGMHWTFWAWNPNSGDTGGVLTDDWTTVHTDKMALLTALQRREAIPFSGGSGPAPTASAPASPSATPSPVPSSPAPSSPAPSSPASGLTARLITDSQWNGGWCGKVAVANPGAAPVAIQSVAVTLPAGSSVTSVWNGTPSVAGRSLVVRTPAWASAPAGGTYSDTGMCVTVGTPTDPTVNGGTPAPTATPTVAPSVTPTPTPTATPTVVPTPPVTPSPTASPTATSPGGTLTARLVTDSRWNGGWCGRITVTNTGTARSAVTTLGITLAPGSTVTSLWNGTGTASGQVLAIRTPAWAAVDPGRTYTDTGLCVTGEAPTQPTVTP